MRREGGKPRVGAAPPPSCRATTTLPRTAAPSATDARVAAADDDARFQDEIAALVIAGLRRWHCRTATNWPGASPAGRSRGGGPALAARCGTAAAGRPAWRFPAPGAAAPADRRRPIREAAAKCNARAACAWCWRSRATRWPQGRCMSSRTVWTCTRACRPGRRARRRGARFAALPPGDSSILLSWRGAGSDDGRTRAVRGPRWRTGAGPIGGKLFRPGGQPGLSPVAARRTALPARPPPGTTLACLRVTHMSDSAQIIRGC